MTTADTRPLPLLNDSDIIRFWSKVAITANDNKCWEWIGGFKRKDRPYGRFSKRVNTIETDLVATRVAYLLQKNVNPVGKSVLHICDNTKCVNGKHLFLGTEKDNAIDMMKKGRGKMQFENGENHKMAKLTVNQVLEIREKYTKGITSKELATEYGISQNNISQIISRRRWNHI